jgi:predicted nucleic acid-binding protein
VLIVDPGPLVATADRADRDHAACRALLESDEGPLVTTAMVIAEAAYLIDRQLGAKAEASLYASIIARWPASALPTGSGSRTSQAPTRTCGWAGRTRQ